jgi:rhodanese-related sulfurtransferase
MIKTEKFGILTLLAIAALISFGVNAFSPSGIALTGQWDKSKGVVTAKSKQDTVHSEFELNDPRKVRQMIKDKTVVLLDVRSKDEYDQGHLPGAFSFPLTVFDEILDRLLNLVKKDSVILVYCSGVECTDSHSFAAQLQAMRFMNVQVYAGGFRQWQEMGFEISKNEG